MNWEFGVGRCKLLHLEWINNKVLLYSTRSYIQSPVINHNGKEFFLNECTYMCITESLWYTVEIGTTLKINYSSIFKKNACYGLEQAHVSFSFCYLTSQETSYNSLNLSKPQSLIVKYGDNSQFKEFGGADKQMR